MKKHFLIMTLIILFISVYLFSSCGVASDKTSLEVSEAGTQGTISIGPETAEDGPSASVAEETDVSEIPGEIIPISPEEVKELIESGSNDYFLIDVRTPEEFAEGYIKSANLIPVTEIENRLDEIPKDKQVIVYCRSGSRSRTAAETLVNNGFEKVYNLGGITDWNNKGFEVVVP